MWLCYYKASWPPFPTTMRTQMQSHQHECPMKKAYK
jgi:hypothetical protein